MNTSFRITATAPTAYQLQSLRHFGIEVVKNGNGSYSATKEFDSEDEAKAYLVERAEMYFDGNSDNDEANLSKAIESIANHGSLTLDAATASIEEVEN